MFDPSEKDNLYNGPLFSELEDDLQDGNMLYLEDMELTPTSLKLCRM